MTNTQTAVKAQKKIRKPRALRAKAAMVPAENAGPSKAPQEITETSSAEAAMAPAEKAEPRKTPQEILAELRARRAVGLEPGEKPANGKTLNDLIAERKQRNEDAYCEKLRAQGKPIYTPQDVVSIGYKLDPSWTQEDLQSRMLVGPVLVPLKRLQGKADEYHQSFVIPGRKAVVEIMAEVYRLFLLAMVPERCTEVFKVIRYKVEARLRKKLAEDATFASQFIRVVFTEFDDRKVHLYSRALDFAYSSNVSADAFTEWVARLGGWEKVRQEAAKAFNTSPDVLIAKKAKELDEEEAESLIERWRILRGVVDTLHINGKLSKKLGAQPGRFLLEITWWPDHHPSVDVYGGHFEVMDILPNSEAVASAAKEMRVKEAKLERDGLKQLVERMHPEAYEALDEETKTRYEKLAAVRGALTAPKETNNDAANDAPMAAEVIKLKSFA